MAVHAGADTLHSFDMLGEAACNDTDAQGYLKAYSDAIKAIVKQSKTTDPRQNPGISVKLPAVHPRYELAQTERVMAELVPRLKTLALAAKAASLGLSIDAEEAGRLALSLSIIGAVLVDPDLAGWDGFGVVVQAYGPRAGGIIDHLYELAKRHNRQITIRLVKGAYWDNEIKQAQVQGLDGFPVFITKVATDISYIANARKLFAMTDRIYPQFTTHNANSIAAILEMAPNQTCFEFQRLHGMGEALHKLVHHTHAIRCRIYASVGTNKDLLAYLVRRLLENGANSSFVNQIMDPVISPEQVAADPFTSYMACGKPLVTGRQLFLPERQNSMGYDLADFDTLSQINQRRDHFAGCDWSATPLLAGRAKPIDTTPRCNPAVPEQRIGQLTPASATDICTAFNSAATWQTTAINRADALNTAADLFEQHDGELFALLAREAGKTLADAVSELREAVDFLRYYAAQVKAGHHGAKALGIVACISPWNFPLAIFTGQIAAALAAGNAVLAKPAEQTPLIANYASRLLHQAGVPRSALQI